GGTTGTTVFRCTSALAVASMASVANSNSRVTSVVADTSGDIALAYDNSVSSSSLIVYSSDLSSIKPAAASMGGRAGAMSAITGVTTGTNALTYFLCDSGVNGSNIYKATVAGGSYTITTATVLTRGIGIAAKAFTSGSTPYCPGWYPPNGAGLSQTRFQT